MNRVAMTCSRLSEGREQYIHGTLSRMAYSLLMPERPAKPKTQKTPKGVEIPIPTRGEVYRDLGEMAKPRKKVAPPGPES